MFVKRKRNRSGSVSVVVSDKRGGSYKELITIGVSKDEEEIQRLVIKGREWIRAKELESQFSLDLFGEEEKAKLSEREETERFISNISNIFFNGVDLILNRVFDSIGFNHNEDDVFRKLVLSRLSFPSSKAATIEYLKNYYDEDISLSRIYRYLDTLDNKYQYVVQDISVRHTMKILGGHIGLLFYDVTTLYFETDKEDDLRKTGFSKEGRHSNPQIILGLLVSLDGYPLAYTIHEGNKYEGHTILPVIEGFVKEYQLEGFTIVADSGLMNEENLLELEKLNYKYIIGARIKNESKVVRKEILSLSHDREDGHMLKINKENKRTLLIEYSEKRAKKDAYNRQKGIQRLEKSYRSGKLTKENVNKRGYNKFLEMKGETQVSINYDKIQEDARWDGLKGFLTNTTLSADKIHKAYYNLWHVERAFRIAKSKIEIRPSFHFTPRRIRAHICICFVAYKVYKELDRILKTNNIEMSVDKVLNMAKTITTIQVYLPENKCHVTKTLIMKRHQKIQKLFNDEFWGTH